MQVRPHTSRLEKTPVIAAAARIAQYDLLCQPFYKAWSAGELTTEELREYALDYYPHVQAFPAYLAAFGIRLEEGELRQAVLANMRHKQRGEDAFGEPGRAHCELWLDFAEGMGAARSRFGHPTVREVERLVQHFTGIASQGGAEAALAAFYAYAAQVPRIAKDKNRGLRDKYGASEQACRHFVRHASADEDQALAKALWKALDGIEARRMSAVAA